MLRNKSYSFSANNAQNINFPKVMTWQTQKEAEAIYSTINTETVKLRTRKTCYTKESRGVGKK